MIVLCFDKITELAKLLISQQDDTSVFICGVLSHITHVYVPMLVQRLKACVLH